jgi:uncharacterized protein (DUF1778 family)
VRDAEAFNRSCALATERRERLVADVDEVGNRRNEVVVEQSRARDESNRINAELRSLQGRASNIDARSLAIRESLCHALGVEESDLPFAGELIQVSPEHADWQGAAERVLRGFALSVLVPAQHYDAASRWIDSHLGARLVYFRVSPRITGDTAPLRQELVLADLLDVKPGPFAAGEAGPSGARVRLRAPSAVPVTGSGDRLDDSRGHRRTGASTLGRRQSPRGIRPVDRWLSEQPWRCRTIAVQFRGRRCEMAITKTRRLEVRTDAATDELIEEAAELLHVSKSAFVTDAARREAERVVARSDVTVMAPEIFDSLMATLETADESPEMAELVRLPRLIGR